MLLTCGAEVGVRIYESLTGASVSSVADSIASDPSKLCVPSWSVYQELKPSAVAKIESRDSESEIELRTNSLGLRGADPAIPKPSNTWRIVVIGDETVLAPETAESNHFCTLLQNLLQQRTRSQVEVINAGIPGHCPLTEYVLFKQRLLSLQPDLVLLHFDWSDVADDRQIRRVARCDADGIAQSCPNGQLIPAKKIKPHEIWRKQFRLFDWVLSAASDRWKQQLARQKAASRDVDTNPYAWLREDKPQKNVSFRLSVQPIADLAELCHSSQIQFALLTSPKPWQVSARCSRGEGVRLAAGVSREACYSNREPFNVLARFAQKQKIPLIDGSKVLAAGKDVELNYLRYAPRWSQQGHQRIADQTAQFIAGSMPGPWSNPYTPQEERFPVSRTIPDSQIRWTSDEQVAPKPR